jgi:predicted Ser/Thr protein kinase
MNKKEQDNCCEHCGHPLGSKSVQGLCPACMLKAGWPTATEDQASEKGFALPTVDELGLLFPKLEILELIGRGGMGAVYKARQAHLNRTVALKLLPAKEGSDPGFAERFTREAQALARLNHRHIVGVYEYGQVEGFHYFIMEYVDGLNLRQIQQAGTLSPREALDIVPQICEALQFAHDKGVVHRDIKPENVLLDQTGCIKIADFGLAKLIGPDRSNFTLTEPNHVMGTPHYMAPEQVEHPKDVDHRADIYSLGVVFYELLTGELPLGKFAPPSQKVQVDVRLDEVVLKSLEKEPQLRYQTVGQVGTDVRTIATSFQMSSSGRVLNNVRFPVYVAGIEYRSQRRLWGLPLVHVATGWNPETGLPRVARGILAIGNIATGVIALGGVAVGGLAFGGLSIGCISFGGLALALAVALGGAALGFCALGGGAVGYYAFGGAALGVHALGSNVQDPAALALIETWRTALSETGLYILLCSLALALCAGICIIRLMQRIQVKQAGVDRHRLYRRRAWMSVVVVLLVMISVFAPAIWQSVERQMAGRHKQASVYVEALPGFTPMCELSLQAGPELQNCFVDLDTGRILGVPPALAEAMGGHGHPQINHELAQWMQDNGVDLFRRTNDLTLIDGISIPVGDGHERPFETITAEKMARDGAYFRRFLDEELPPDPNAPCRTTFTLRQKDTVYLILTRSGRPGLIHVLQDKPDTGVLRIRYKLVSMDMVQKASRTDASPDETVVPGFTPQRELDLQLEKGRTCCLADLNQGRISDDILDLGTRLRDRSLTVQDSYGLRQNSIGLALHDTALSLIDCSVALVDTGAFETLTAQDVLLKAARASRRIDSDFPDPYLLALTYLDERNTPYVFQLGSGQTGVLEVLEHDPVQQHARIRYQLVAISNQFSTTLANGITVELVGVCTDPSVGQQWWKPDGSPLPESPYDDDEVGAFPKIGAKGYKFAVAFTGIGGREMDISMNPLSFRTANSGFSLQPSKKNGKDNATMLGGKRDAVVVGQGAAIDERRTVCHYKVGICYGDWEREYRIESDEPNDGVEWVVFRNVSLQPPSADLRPQKDVYVPPTGDTSAWEMKLSDLSGDNWRQAFAVGQELAALDPNQGFAILRINWLRITSIEARQQLLKAWFYQSPAPFTLRWHPHLLGGLDLGMRDPPPGVEEWAAGYLKQVAFQDFTRQFKRYQRWYAANRDRSLEEVFAASLGDAVDRLRLGDAAVQLEQLDMLKEARNRFRRNAVLRRLAQEAGLAEALEACAGSEVPEVARRAWEVKVDFSLDGSVPEPVALPAAGSD